MRQRISPKDMQAEKKAIFSFFFFHLKKGFWSTHEMFKNFKRFHPSTKLSLNGFGRMIPKHFKRAVKRMDNKLYRGVEF